MGEEDPEIVSNFMGFSYETARRFFRLFLQDYLGTDDENRINEVAEKASLIGYSRLIRKLRKKMTLSDGDRALISHCVEKIAELTDKLDSLEI